MVPGPRAGAQVALLLLLKGQSGLSPPLLSVVGVWLFVTSPQIFVGREGVEGGGANEY